jgi:hypothetical protein
MTENITLPLPLEIRNALEEATRAEGVSSEELVRRALRQYLFLRRFRRLADRLSAEAQNQGIFTDQDVFDRVS